MPPDKQTNTIKSTNGSTVKSLDKPFKIKMLISYDGTDYGGWQRQKKGKSTVQQEIESALSRVFTEPITICGSGRTDAGVHALGQVAHAWVPKEPSNYNLLHALNGMTPSSIAVKAVWQVPNDFHAIASSIDKTYKYLVLNSPTPSALRDRYTHWQRLPLDLERLRSYSKLLVGKQDFNSFKSRGTDVPSTIREVYSADWSLSEKHLLTFTVRGSGFLKQMVRTLVGTQIDLALKKAPASDFSKIIQAHDRQAAGVTAPPQGLYLCSVRYPPELDNKCRKL